MEINITNYKENIDIQIDLLVVEKIDHLEKIIACSLVTIRQDKNALRIKFEWKENDEIEGCDFFHITETNTLFFRSQNQWGAIDIEKRVLKRHEKAMWFPSIDMKDKYVLIQDDLNAESVKLDGEKIHSVPIDPPTESKEFEDRIEYNSPVFGKQTLKLR